MEMDLATNGERNRNKQQQQSSSPDTKASSLPHHARRKIMGLSMPHSDSLSLPWTQTPDLLTDKPSSTEERTARAAPAAARPLSEPSATTVPHARSRAWSADLLQMGLLSSVEVATKRQDRLQASLGWLRWLLEVLLAAGLTGEWG